MNNDTLKKQRGFTIVMVMAIMMIIAIMIVAGAAQTNTELRMSANDADRKLAFSVADEALVWAETEVAKETLHKAKERADKELNLKECDKALCPALLTANNNSDVDALKWSYDQVFSCEGKSDEASDCKKLNDPSKQVKIGTENTTKLYALPRYVGEYLGKGHDGTYYVRVTVRAWGVNPNTQVTLQSYIEFGE